MRKASARKNFFFIGESEVSEESEESEVPEESEESEVPIPFILHSNEIASPFSSALNFIPSTDSATSCAGEKEVG